MYTVEILMYNKNFLIEVGKLSYEDIILVDVT